MQGLKPGAMLRHDTYRIERTLGQGGFGITYLATDLNLDRKVAIKEFFPKNYCDRNATTSCVDVNSKSSQEFVSKLKAKFLKEARNIAKLDDPGIIRIHAAFEENNTAYYVMDFIEGKSLSEIVKQNGPLPLSRALKFITETGRALEYVHARKINHLDVKPANIMVRRADDSAILIDFGLSKRYDSSGKETSDNPVGMSHGYAPMEQYKEGGVKEFSPQTDLYSLAATLYYILSGVTPPQAPELIETALTFPSSIPARLIAPVSKAMSPTRWARQASVGEFIKEITNAGATDETEVPPGPRPNPGPRTETQPNPWPEPETPPAPGPGPGPRRKLYIGLAIIVAVLAGGIFWFAGRSGGDLPGDDTTTVSAAETVSEMYWESPLGIASYSGEVASGTSGSQKIPHGKGVAKITAGKYKGNVYDGEFVDGRMEGQAVYTLASGDTFKGTFKNNKFHQGRYTSKETGDYYEGSYDSEGAPKVGAWFNRNGKKL